jgi:poly-gamma-glutamate synthase PgsB/CapB
MIVLLFLVIALVAFGVWEYVRHQKNVNSIPIRVHVNGTRGKSSVTRLIAAGLRAGGYDTFAKTTGTLPRIIDNKGLEVPIIRPHGANIIEQVKIFRYVARRHPQAIVIECMAVQPPYQWICERQLVRSTVGVITNARPDHLREMGPSIYDVTRSLCNTLPAGKIAFTSEKKMFSVMQAQAKSIRCDLRQVDQTAISEAEMMAFGHVEHPDNVTLALAVCEHLGVARDTALQGMYHSHPDSGALKIYTVVDGAKTVRFTHAMAANDPESTLDIWIKLQNRLMPNGKVITLINTRADRFDRSIQLLEMLVGNISFDYLMLTGEVVERVLSIAHRLKIPHGKIVAIGRAMPEKVYQQILELIHHEGFVFAMGNVGSGGLALARHFEKIHKEQLAQRQQADDEHPNEHLTMENMT